jgi:hypothetical protein
VVPPPFLMVPSWLDGHGWQTLARDEMLLMLPRLVDRCDDACCRRHLD